MREMIFDMLISVSEVADASGFDDIVDDISEVLSAHFQGSEHHVSAMKVSFRTERLH